MRRTRSLKFRSKIVTTLVALLIVGLMAPTAGATIVVPKLFTMTVSPSTSPSGASTQFTATFTNWWLQKLGSANLSVPAAYSITSVLSSRGTATVVGNTVQLRSLDLAFLRSFTVKVTAAAGCTPSAGNVWSAAAKTGADFTGSAFLLLTPQHKRTSAVIGPCPSVRVVECEANKDCIGSVSQDRTGATVTALAGSAGGDLTMSLTSTPEEGIDCGGGGDYGRGGGGYEEHSSTLTFNVTTPRAMVVTMSFDTLAPVVDPGAYQVCFESESDGGPVLLPPCDTDSWSDPCVEGRSVVGSVVYVRFRVPAGDPKGRI